jgi:hypothetical protein
MLVAMGDAVAWSKPSGYDEDRWGFTLWLFNIAMENGPFIDGLPIKNGWIFPWRTVSHNQMVSGSTSFFRETHGI